MAGSNSTAQDIPIALDLVSLQIYAWTFTGVTILFSFGRYALRYMTRKRLGWDDLTHFLAMVTMIAMVSCLQRLFPDAYFLTQVGRRKLPPPSQQESVELFVRGRKLQYSLTMLFFASTWMVKITFLIFYRELFGVNRHFMKAWWAVLAIVFLTFWVCVAAVTTQCGSAKEAFNIKACTTQWSRDNSNKVIKYTCAVSVLTDVLILVLPIWMLKDLKVRTAQKLSLAFMFSLGIVIVACDILRTVRSVEQTDFTEVAAYVIAVVCIAVIVSSLPTYRALLSPDMRRKTSEYVKLQYGSRWKSSSRVDDSHPFKSGKSEGAVSDHSHV